MGYIVGGKELVATLAEALAKAKAIYAATGVVVSIEAA